MAPTGPASMPPNAAFFALSPTFLVLSGQLHFGQRPFGAIIMANICCWLILPELDEALGGNA